MESAWGITVRLHVALGLETTWHIALVVDTGVGSVVDAIGAVCYGLSTVVRGHGVGCLIGRSAGNESHISHIPVVVEFIHGGGRHGAAVRDTVHGSSYITALDVV